MSEAGEIRRDGAKAQKNSGRGKIQKGDAKWHNFIIDYKEYPKGYRVTPENWRKICTDTFTSDPDMSPLLKVILGDGQQKIRLGIIEWEWLEELVTFYEQNCGIINE